MGKGKKLAILLAVVAVLLGGYFAAMHFFGDSEEETPEDGESIAVQALQPDEIVGIQYNYGDEVITLVKENDQWYMADDKTFPVEQAIPDLIASDAAGLTARRLISEDPDDFAEYGLDNPTSAYVFTKADGTNVTYFIGNYNNFGGTYYFNVAGTNQIYLIDGDFLEDFDAGTSKLADVPDIPTASTDQVTGLRLLLDGKTTLVQHYEDGLETAYTGTLEWFLDKSTPADPVQTHTFIGKAVGYSSTGCAAYQADDAKLKAFGLDAPVAELFVQYTVTEQQETGETDADGVAVTETVSTPESLRLAVGKQSPDGSYYAKADGCDAVYLLSPEYMDDLRAFDLSSLRAADVCKLSSDEVLSMDVTIDGKTHKITIDRSDDSSIVFKLDGTQITAVQFNNFFSAIQSVVSDGFAKEKNKQNEVLRIVYHTNRSGFETITLTISSYDRNLYVSSLNDGEGVLLSKSAFDKICSAFDAMQPTEGAS